MSLNRLWQPEHFSVPTFPPANKKQCGDVGAGEVLGPQHHCCMLRLLQVKVALDCLLLVNRIVWEKVIRILQNVLLLARALSPPQGNAFCLQSTSFL